MRAAQIKFSKDGDVFGSVDSKHLFFIRSGDFRVLGYLALADALGLPAPAAAGASGAAAATAAAAAPEPQPAPAAATAAGPAGFAITLDGKNLKPSAGAGAGLEIKESDSKEPAAAAAAGSAAAAAAASVVDVTCMLWLGAPENAAADAPERVCWLSDTLNWLLTVLLTLLLTVLLLVFAVAGVHSARALRCAQRAECVHSNGRAQAAAVLRLGERAPFR